MSKLRDTIRADLTSAMKERDLTKVRVLRNLLAALDNAAAVPIHDFDSAGRAGAIEFSAGPGETEVPRKKLTPAAERKILKKEYDELYVGGAAASVRGDSERSTILFAQAALVHPYTVKPPGR